MGKIFCKQVLVLEYHYMEHSVIKNAEVLGTTPLRKDGLAILEAGYRAIMTKEVMRNRIDIDELQLTVDGHSFPFGAYERVFFVGIGKCALDAGQAIEEKLGAWLTDGIILDVRGAPLRKMRSYIGTHPFPSEQNVEVATSIAKMLEGLTDRDLLITVVSGGASSLLCLPHDISCDTVTLITKTLMESGATIDELNKVRKHTSKIQGGQFAKMAFPATVISLIFSDVPGDDISMVASGPTVMDTTTMADAQAVLEKYDIEKICKIPHCGLIETPKEEKYFERVHNILFVTNETALVAMQEEAEKRGYTTRIENTGLQGEAREVGALLAREATDQKTCRLFGGETTVTVHKPGKGGRCQEAVLGALPVIGEHALFVAATSDGWDNTPFAGAIGDTEVFAHAQELGLDPKTAGEENQAFNFFEKTGAHIDTGRTGANVSDWYFTITE